MVVDMNTSLPLVSQIEISTLLRSTLRLLESKSIPIVGPTPGLNVSLAKRLARLVFPTPSSPINSSLKLAAGPLAGSLKMREEGFIYFFLPKLIRSKFEGSACFLGGLSGFFLLSYSKSIDLLYISSEPF